MVLLGQPTACAMAVRNVRVDAAPAHLAARFGTGMPPSKGSTSGLGFPAPAPARSLAAVPHSQRFVMPDRRQHRGPHPEDRILFGPSDRVHTLRQAAGDLAWLLGRHYAPTAALTLVGNRYQLHARQRQALARAVAAPAVADVRRQRQVLAAALAGQALDVDGFNQLITVEVALAGGLLLRGHDGALRDLASVHGTYRTMTDTPRALMALGTVLAALHVQTVRFVLDAPVSNAGRLAQQMRALADDACVALGGRAGPQCRCPTASDIGHRRDIG